METISPILDYRFEKMLSRCRQCRFHLLPYHRSQRDTALVLAMSERLFWSRLNTFFGRGRSCVELGLLKGLRNSVTYNKQMKSGLILILATFLFLATSAVIDNPEPVDENESVDLPKQPLNKLKWNKDSPFLSKFTVKGNTVKKTSADERFQVLLTPPIQFDSLKASFQINSYGGKDEGFFIGLITEKRFSEKESQGVYDDTCALYTTPKEKKGNIYVNGKEVEAWNEDWYVPEGSIIDVDIDMAFRSVYFYNRASSTHKRMNLPFSYIGLKLYVFVNAYHNNASFELL